jgi:two-component system phosphate regulon response regulator PhoB
MVVEDDPFLRDVLAEILAEELGVEPQMAGDGAEALELLRDGAHPDLVLLDMTLPLVDGATVLREIKKDERTRDIPVVAMGGMPPERLVGVLRQGAQGYLAKPFGIDQIQAALKAWLPHAA